MDFVLFETESGMWVTTPDLEEACKKEMQDAGVLEFDRYEKTVKSSLLIEARINWVLSD